MKQHSFSVRRLAVSAVLLAMAFLLSYVKIAQLPFGGALTLCSMLPLCVISLKYGVLWGMGCGFCYSLLQILQGGVFGWGLTPGILTAALLLDYIAAFTVLGLTGCFRQKGTVGVLLGTVSALTLRFLCHFISGIVLWTNVEQFTALGKSFFDRPVLYSLLYNGAYMLPELLLTLLVLFLLYRLPQLHKLLTPEN